MIVLDTSAAVELILGLPLARPVQDRLESADWQIAAPQLLTVEVLQVLRRRVSVGMTSLENADAGIRILQDLGIRYVDHQLLAGRVWQLCDNLTAYDAAYVALAELLGSELLTADAGIARAPGHRATVRVVS